MKSSKISLKLYDIDQSIGLFALRVWVFKAQFEKHNVRRHASPIIPIAIF